MHISIGSISRVSVRLLLAAFVGALLVAAPIAAAQQVGVDPGPIVPIEIPPISVPGDVEVPLLPEEPPADLGPASPAEPTRPAPATPAPAPSVVTPAPGAPFAPTAAPAAGPTPAPAPAPKAIESRPLSEALVASVADFAVPLIGAMVIAIFLMSQPRRAGDLKLDVERSHDDLVPFERSR